jgi:hypothetical protein
MFSKIPEKCTEQNMYKNTQYRWKIIKIHQYSAYSMQFSSKFH